MADFYFQCQNCETQSPKWAGRCLECGRWGTMEKVAAATIVNGLKTAAERHEQALNSVAAGKPTAFSAVKASALQRVRTNILEFDRVVGGGIVPGSLILLGGDPGIGKSTLVAQLAAAVAAVANAPGDVLYVSGEESAEQIKLRLDRLQLEQDAIQFLGEEQIEVIGKTILEIKPALAIIDSIQTVASAAVEAEPGSVAQIKACTVRLLETAKASGIPVMIVGHVTKGGELGGPKTLEHLVDTVLYLEGDNTHQFRLLRSVKNRFGSTNEVGVFTMQQQGLQPVDNPSQIFLDERSHNPGSCMTAVVEGTRIMLLEVQALVTKTVFGYPQRKSSGFDLNRLNVLLAVLARRAGVVLDAHDVHINIAGGWRVSEPAVELAVALAIVSAWRDVELDQKIAAFGEIGLGGEVRSVVRGDDRVKEARRFGLTHVLSPQNIKTLAAAIDQVGLSS